MRSAARLAGLLVVVGFAGGGCNGNPYFSQQPFGQTGAQPTTNAHTAQLQELSRRVTQLDADNRDLHARLAQKEQEIRKQNELALSLQKQLSETAQQAAQLAAEKSDATQKLASVKTATQHRGGATITANNSLHNSLNVIDIPGVEVRQDGPVIRIELPSDRVFVQGSDQLQQTALQTLEQVSVAIRQNYPQQRIGVEGHTDNALVPGIATNHHQLATNQASAVFNQLLRSGRFQANQLTVVSHGANHPRFSNGDPAGRARNRRVELVIYPDAVQ